jgi:hypothetical protein
LRRWAQRRLLSVCSWLRARVPGTHFFERPPSLPGISARSAVFCGSRQAVRDSKGPR